MLAGPNLLQAINSRSKVSSTVSGPVPAHYNCAEMAAMRNDLYFDTPQAAMAQVVTDLGLRSSTPLESILMYRRGVPARLFINGVPTWILRLGSEADQRFAAVQFHLPHARLSGPEGRLAHLHVRQVIRVDDRTRDSNQGTRIRVRDVGELWILRQDTHPGCRHHYFINKLKKNSKHIEKAFEEFTRILPDLLERCRNKAQNADYTTVEEAADVASQFLQAWKLAILEPDSIPPPSQEPVNWFVKSAIPSAVALEVGNAVAVQVGKNVANRAALEAGKKVGVKVLGKGVGQSVGKAVGGIGSVGGLVTDVALVAIPGASEAVGEGGRIGIGFAASAGVGAAFGGPVGAAIGVVGYGIGEGISQLFKLF